MYFKYFLSQRKSLVEIFCSVYPRSSDINILSFPCSLLNTKIFVPIGPSPILGWHTFGSVIKSVTLTLDSFHHKANIDDVLDGCLEIRQFQRLRVISQI